MSAEEILGIYKDIIRNPDKLKQGKELLENFINTVPQFTTITCKIITSTEVPSNDRKNVCYVIKNVLKDSWMVSPALANERQAIKETLLNGVVENLNDSKIIEALSLIIAELIKQEGAEGWQPYLNELIKWINTEEIPRIKAGIECLCLVFTFTDDRIRNIVPDLMPILYQIFNLPQLPERLREKVLMLLYLAINSFSWAERSDDQLIHDCFDSTYEQWLKIFIQVLQTPPKQHLSMKKYILKILTKIFADIPRYAKQAFAVMIQPVWNFMNSTLPVFIWSVVYGVPVELIEDGMKVAPKAAQATASKTKDQNNDGFELDEDIDLSNEVEALAIQLIELMQTLLPNKKLRSFVKVGLFPLVNCISHYMLFSKYQEKTWFEEPNEFQAEEEDAQGMVSTRKGALEILSNLVANFEDEAVQAIMIISEKFLANMREEEVYSHLQDVFNKLNNSTSKSAALSNFDSDKLTAMIKTSHFDGEHDDHIWKKREIGLLLMGSFAEDIVDFLIRTTPDYNVLSLIEKLIGDFDTNTNPILKGRALWCATQFSEVVAKQGIKPIVTLFRLGAGCVASENHLPVRLAAVKAIKTFAYQIHTKFLQDLTEDVKAEFRLNDIQVAIDIFDLLPKCSEDTLHIVLEGLLILAKINNHHIPKHSELICTKIVQMFQMVHNDPLNGELIKDIIKYYSTNSEGYTQLIQVFLPYIAEILQFKLDGNSISTHLDLGTSTEYAFLSSIFDIIRLFVTAETTQKQIDHLMELYPFILKYIAVTSDYTLLSHASVCLKAYIGHCSQQILQRNHLDDTLAVISKMLQPETEEVACTYLGNIIILTFANLLNNSINQDILKAVINKLYHCQVPSTIQSLVLVYARLINMDEKDTLEFLCSFSVDNVPALKILMTKWLSYQPLFIGRNTKVLTYLALTKILLAKDNRVENLQVKSATDSAEAYTPFKIVSLLVRGLDAEVQNKANANSEINAYKEFIQDGDDDGFEDVDDDDDGDVYANERAQRRNKEDDYADYDDGEVIPGDFAVEEAERLAEEDLELLKDACVSIDLLEMFKSFFTTVPKSENQYFMFCMKNLPAEDVQTLQKYIEFK